jgi:dTDP-4-dehydrorhamnose 3,5-epimerase
LVEPPAFLPSRLPDWPWIEAQSTTTAGFADGFQTLSDDAEVRYHISERYRPDAARGVRWDDPDLAIAWPPTEQRVISRRAQTLPRLRDL